MKRYSEGSSAPGGLRFALPQILSDADRNLSGGIIFPFIGFRMQMLYVKQQP